MDTVSAIFFMSVFCTFVAYGLSTRDKYTIATVVKLLHNGVRVAKAYVNVFMVGCSIVQINRIFAMYRSSVVLP